MKLRHHTAVIQVPNAKNPGGALTPPRFWSVADPSSAISETLTKDLTAPVVGNYDPKKQIKKPGNYQVANLNMAKNVAQHSKSQIEAY